MKNLFLPLLICSSFISNSQIKIDSLPFDDNGSVRVEKVFEVKGSADELMTKIKIWAAQFDAFKKVVRVEDREQHILSGGGAVEYGFKLYKKYNKSIDTIKGIFGQGVGVVNFTMNFYFKDNKVKVFFNEFSLMSSADDERYNDVKLNKDFVSDLKKELSGTSNEQIKAHESLSRISGIFEQIPLLFDMIQKELNKKSEKDF